MPGKYRTTATSHAGFPVRSKSVQMLKADAEALTMWGGAILGQDANGKAILTLGAGATVIVSSMERFADSNTLLVHYIQPPQQIYVQTEVTDWEIGDVVALDATGKAIKFVDDLTTPDKIGFVTSKVIDAKNDYLHDDGSYETFKAVQVDFRAAGGM